MESVVRMLMAMLLTVSAASAVQFSMVETFGRISKAAGSYECKVGQAAEYASRAMVHRAAERMARSGLKTLAAASPASAQNGRCEIAQTMEDLWKAYGH